MVRRASFFIWTSFRSGSVFLIQYLRKVEAERLSQILQRVKEFAKSGHVTLQVWTEELRAIRPEECG